MIRHHGGTGGGEKRNERVNGRNICRCAEDIFPSFARYDKLGSASIWNEVANHVLLGVGNVFYGIFLLPERLNPALFF